MRRATRTPLPWLGALLALYLLAPIVAFLVRLARGVSAPPGIGPALLTSLLTATISTLIIALLGIPLAYGLARMRGAPGNVALALVALPLALPALSSGLLLLYVVGPYTTIGKWFGGGLTESRAGIVLAQIFVAAPFLVIAARAAFQSIDPGLVEMAAVLGHGPISRFTRAAVPAALPGILAGLTLAWLRAFGEFGATVILAYHPYSLPVFTYVQFDSTGLPGTTLPVAAALGAAVVVGVLSGTRPPRRRATVTAAPEPPIAIRPAEAIDFDVRGQLGGFAVQVAYSSRSPRLALLGPSGAGKTATLRLLSGVLTAQDPCRVYVGSQRVDHLPPERRGLAYVPQQPALLPRLDLWRQVSFGTRADPALAAMWIERFGLGGLERRFPEELSGGQQRRVAIVRALATAPRVLLLDEPFAGLDAPVRAALRRELRRLQQEWALGTVLVTHDATDAALLADDLIVLREGRTLQAGVRAHVMAAPASPEVAGVLGIANVNRGLVSSESSLSCAGHEIRTRAKLPQTGSEVVWSVRPEYVALATDGPLEARLLDDADLGGVHELTLGLGAGVELIARSVHPPAACDDSRVQLDLPAEHVEAWPAPTTGGP